MGFKVLLKFDFDQLCSIPLVNKSFVTNAPCSIHQFSLLGVDSFSMINMLQTHFKTSKIYA